jgi:hypothetical protein
MNGYIEKVFNDFISENKGYTYIGAEDIYIPVFRVTLFITKRKHTTLNLMEEMVLKIANCGVNDLDEISGILGLDRDILDITIGDLFVKNLAYPSSNKCYLMTEGRNILRYLKVSKKETDSIRDIFINTLNQEILKERNNNIVNRCLDDDCMVRHTFDGKDIEFYRNRVGDIKEIFNKEHEIYTSDSSEIPDELVSIDGIENISVMFLKIPIFIYISETGTDLDLISSDNRMRDLLDGIKGRILTQIREHKLLKKIFTKFTIEKVDEPIGKFMNSDELKILIKKYVADKNNQSSYYNLITEKVFSNRVLIENELEKLFELFLRDSIKVFFYLDNLNYWAKNAKFLTLLTMIPKKTKFVIYYNNATLLTIAEKLIKSSVQGISKDNIVSYFHNDWFKIMFDNKLQIIGCPQIYKTVDPKINLVKGKYFLQILNK